MATQEGEPLATLSWSLLSRLAFHRRSKTGDAVERAVQAVGTIKAEGWRAGGNNAKEGEEEKREERERERGAQQSLNSKRLTERNGDDPTFGTSQAEDERWKCKKSKRKRERERMRMRQRETSRDQPMSTAMAFAPAMPSPKARCIPGPSGEYA